VVVQDTAGLWARWPAEAPEPYKAPSR
jgi:hypothetical protein